jgi:hypothetical protein
MNRYNLNEIRDDFIRARNGCASITRKTLFALDILFLPCPFSLAIPHKRGSEKSTLVVYFPLRQRASKER